MKKILLFGLVALALTFLIRLLITPGKPEMLDVPEWDPSESIVLGPPPEELGPQETGIYRTQVSEELIRDLQSKLRKLATQFEKGNRSLEAPHLFADTIQYTNSAVPTEIVGGKQDSVFSKSNWQLDAPIETNASAILGRLLSENRLSKTQFGVLSGTLSDDGLEFETLTSFEGSMQNAESICGGFKGTQKIVWRKLGDDWRISQWHQIEFKTIKAESPVFQDVTEKVILEPDAQKLIQSSFHMDLMFKEAAGTDYPQKKEESFRYFHDWHSSAVYPSVNVVDFDGDELEDLFLTGEWVRPLLLRNQGDGTFKDATESAGLMMDEAHINCALFADFDNDGDPDVFLGRTTQPSLFMTNENGVFTKDEVTCKELRNCKFASSASAVDVNRDGLLDLYVSTYCSYGSAGLDWLGLAIEPARRQQLNEQVWGRHSFLDRASVPNALLINDGGSLRNVKPSETIEQWRNTFQAVWIDYDDDGDSDLYVCNDFSPDALLRNDTERGAMDVQFVDVTREAMSGSGMAFGMGATSGDYDSDGDLDLYVSNMYSKAGNRIFGQIGEGTSDEVKVAAAGNFLFNKDGATFEQVAGLGKADQHVAKVGWSFGGQFEDFDNDGNLDLYVPSGLFTAPPEIERQDDL